MDMENGQEIGEINQLNGLLPPKNKSVYKLKMMECSGWTMKNNFAHISHNQRDVHLKFPSLAAGTYAL